MPEIAVNRLTNDSSIQTTHTRARAIANMLAFGALSFSFGCGNQTVHGDNAGAELAKPDGHSHNTGSLEDAAARDRGHTTADKTPANNHSESSSAQSSKVDHNKVAQVLNAKYTILTKPSGFFTSSRFSDLNNQQLSLLDLAKQTNSTYLILIQGGEACPHAQSAMQYWSELGKLPNTAVIWVKSCNLDSVRKTVNGYPEYFDKMLAISDPNLNLGLTLSGLQDPNLIFASTAICLKIENNQVQVMSYPNSANYEVTSPSIPSRAAALSWVANEISPKATFDFSAIDTLYARGCPLSPCSHQ